MKKVFFTAFLLSLATLGFSQTAFTEQILNEIHQGFLTNPVQTVKERVVSNFQMTGDEGQVIDYTTFKSWQEGEKGGLAEWNLSEVKIQYSGNLAVVKGVSRHKPKSVASAYHQRFTETFEFQNGKWMLASLHYTNIASK